jgi:hypothetical protein
MSMYGAVGRAIFKQLFVPTDYRRGPSSRIVRVGLVQDKMTVGQVFFFWVHRFLSIIRPPFFRTKFSVIWGTDSGPIKNRISRRLLYIVTDETAALAWLLRLQVHSLRSFISVWPSITYYGKWSRILLFPLVTLWMWKSSLLLWKQ